MRLLFRLRTGSAGLLEDKKRCKIIICESGVGEDMEHLLVMFGEFERDRWVLADEVSKIVGAEEIWKSVRSVRWYCCWEKVLE